MAETKRTEDFEQAADGSTEPGGFAEGADPFADMAVEGSEADIIAVLEAERDEFRDRLMRALAEAENARKRGERDRREA